MIGRYDEKITRQLFFSMVPVQILLVMCGGVSVIIDSAFASNLIGPDAMAAAGLYGPLAKFLDTVNALMFGGAQIMCGKYLGENVLKRAKSIFTLDMVTTVMLGLAGTVLFMFFPNIASGFCVKPDNPLAGDLMIYLTGLATGVIPYLVGTQLLAFLQLEKKEKLGFAGIGGMFVLNAVLDYVFIAVMDMGIYGLGLATAVSNWVPVLVAGIYFMSSKAVFKLDFSDLHITDLGQIAKNGFPSAGTQLMLAFKGVLLNAIIFRFAGSSGLASFTAVNSFGYIYWAVPAGMSSAMITLASIYTGEKDKSAIELLMRIYFRKAIPIVAGVAVILALLSFPLTNIYFHDPGSDVYQMALLGFVLFPLYAPFSTFIVGMRDIWRCMDHKIAVNIIVVLDGIVYTTGLSYILSGIFGMTGIWIAQVGGCALLALTILVMAWIIGHKIPKSIPDLCLYPEGFGVEDDSRLTLSLHSMEEVINISEKVIEFCKERGIDKGAANKAGLCIEEMAGNIVRHGFTGKKRESVDISVTKTSEGLVIKLKDNCRLFDPAELGNIFDPIDPAGNIGIRLVRKVCREMEYHSLLGLNVLSITM